MPPPMFKFAWQDLPFAGFLLLWYLVDVSLTLANYVNLIRRKGDIIDSSTQSAYLAFVIIGMIAFFLVSAVCFVWAMHTTSRKDMRNKIQIGVVFTWLLSDVPFFFLNFFVFLNYGWFDWLQALEFLVVCVSFFIGAVIVWTSWMWRTGKLLQRWVGDPLYPSAAIGHGAVDGTPMPAGIVAGAGPIMVASRRRTDPSGEMV